VRQSVVDHGAREEGGREADDGGGDEQEGDGEQPPAVGGEQADDAGPGDGRLVELRSVGGIEAACAAASAGGFRDGCRDGSDRSGRVLLRLPHYVAA
jgi:hypothetical protein